jgi:hypothetical protein
MSLLCRAQRKCLPAVDASAKAGQGIDCQGNKTERVRGFHSPDNHSSDEFCNGLITCQKIKVNQTKSNLIRVNQAILKHFLFLVRGGKNRSFRRLVRQPLRRRWGKPIGSGIHGPAKNYSQILNNALLAHSIASNPVAVSQSESNQFSLVIFAFSAVKNPFSIAEILFPPKISG